jgi:hypothetical protein
VKASSNTTRSCDARCASVELSIRFRGDGHANYNVACCESLAGRTTDAIEHRGQAIDIWESCRDMANADSNFDPIRAQPAFHELIGR